MGNRRLCESPIPSWRAVESSTPAVVRGPHPYSRRERAQLPTNAATAPVLKKAHCGPLLPLINSNAPQSTLVMLDHGYM